MASVLRFDEWQDSDGNAVASGAGGVFTSPGSILQVVSVVKTDTFSLATNTFADVTGMAASITPSSASSKVLIMLDMKIGHSDTTNGATMVKLTGGNSGDYVGDAAGNRSRVMSAGVSDRGGFDISVFIQQGGGTYLDSPATTSPVTYQVQIKSTSNGTVHVNRTGLDSDSSGLFRTASSITLMEVAG